MVCLLYLVKVRPFQTGILNLLNIINEAAVFLSCLICLPLVREIETSPELKKFFCSVFCTCYLFLIVLNLLLIAISFVLDSLNKRKLQKI